MSIVIRMSRQGRTNRPHFRVGVWDVKSRRDGPPIEYLGHYDPLVKDDTAKVTLNQERIDYWLSQGASISDSVKSFMVRRGARAPDRRAARSKARRVKKLARRARTAAKGKVPAKAPAKPKGAAKKA